MKEMLTEQEEEMLNEMIASEGDKSMREAAEYYRGIPIPEDLKGMVAQTIGQHAEKEASKEKEARRRRGVTVTLRTFGALAAAIVLFMIPLNMSEAFAEQMQDVPVLGAFAKVLTIRSYSYTENDINVNIQVPEIVALTDGAGGAAEENSDESAFMRSGTAEGDLNAESLTGNGAAEGDLNAEGLTASGADDRGTETNEASGAEMIEAVNAEILEIVETYEAAAKQRFEEYKEVFFATGGTEEEWDGRTCDVDVEYTVTYQEGTRLSLVLTTVESWAAVYAQRYYYNLDVQSGRTLTLEDLLGADWKERCNESIIAEIERRIAEEEDMMYWGYTQGDEYIDDIVGFQSVSEQTSFYINERGNVVVCFDKYEIAPGYMGMQEFEITDVE